PVVEPALGLAWIGEVVVPEPLAPPLAVLEGEDESGDARVRLVHDAPRLRPGGRRDLVVRTDDGVEVSARDEGPELQAAGPALEPVDEDRRTRLPRDEEDLREREPAEPVPPDGPRVEPELLQHPVAVGVDHAGIVEAGAQIVP